jgi:hypothetical protein
MACRLVGIPEDVKHGHWHDLFEDRPNFSLDLCAASGLLVCAGVS